MNDNDTPGSQARQRGVWIIPLYKKISNHIGKIIAAIGLTLMALDVAGQGEQLKSMANDLLGQKGAQKFGVFLFVAAFLRFLYAGYKAQQKQAQIEALQAHVEALARAHDDLASRGRVPPLDPPSLVGEQPLEQTVPRDPPALKVI